MTADELTVERLAEALPGHKYDNPAYPREHEGCLLVARAILRNLERQRRDEEEAA